MATIQNQILDNLDSVLEAVSTIKTVASGTFELYKVTRPAVSVIPDEEATENEADDIYVERLRVAIRVVVDDDTKNLRHTLGELIGDVHRAILADPKRSNLAEDTVKVGIKWLFLDEHFPRAGADVNLLITYSTEEKDPSDINFDIS